MNSAVVTYQDVGALRTEEKEQNLLLKVDLSGAEQEVAIHLRTNVLQVSLGN